MKPENIRKIVTGSIIGVVLISIIISIFIWKPAFMFHKDNTSDTNSYAVLPEVTGYTVNKEQLTDNIGAYGNVSYFKKVNVSPKLEEIAEKVNYEVGDWVDAGKIMLEMNNDALKLAMESSIEEVKSKEAGLTLSQARYNTALQGVEKNYLSLDRLMIDKQQKELEIENASRVLSNKKALLDVEGVALEKYREAEMSYATSKLQYDSIIRQIQAAQIGYRDQDLKEAGLSVPQDKEKKLDSLKQINTMVEKAEVGIAQSEIDKAKIQKRSTEMVLNESIVKAPISGVIAARYIEPGEKVSKDKPVYTIMDLGRVYIDMAVSETELSRIRLGQSVLVKVDAYPDKKVRGIVERIYPMIDPKTRTANVRCIVRNDKLDRNHYLLLPGMFVRSSIVTFVKKESITIPFTAMAEKQDNLVRIFILKPDTDKNDEWLAVEKWVPYLKISDDVIEIAGELKQGDKVAVSGIDYLETGMRVRIKEKAGAK